jgi:AraC-like DNA-binding protein
MNFVLEGNLYQTHEGILNRHLYAQGYHNLLYNPFSWEENQLIGQGDYRIFGVHIAPKKMMDLLTGYIPELAPFADKIDKGQPFVLHGRENALSHQMKYIFDSIWKCPEPPSLRKLYVESKILELLSLQCETLLHKNAAGIFPYSIGKSDIDRAYEARDILLKRLSDPPSLTELSRLCGLNEFKLKKYFVQLFGASVFGFVQSERLELAKNMIYQGEKNVSEIAYHLGYAHPQHFHRAFKKKFGRTPGELRK